MDKSTVEGEELLGNPMLWTIEHWTMVLGPCAGSEGDLLFEKNSVGLTRGEEFSYGPLFETGRQGTNGWKTVDYKDPKRRAIALGIMHILCTTYVTAWQVGFFERILKGKRVHWARIFYNIVWVNVFGRWMGSMTNHLTPFLVNFYRGMGLLTREEEKRFPREREFLTAESSEGTEDEILLPSIPTHTTAREPLQVDLVQRQSSQRNKWQREERSVKKTVAPIVNTSEVAASEVMRPVEIGVPSEVSIEVPADIPAEPLKEGTELGHSSVLGGLVRMDGIPPTTRIRRDEQ
ncbi:hypothetical protein AXG93_2384s1000 [Marchantia polymorpha subsp. ruderalis]|uniref:Uncharacterized protein n=1 Tax=Marchantia polymorpha subsp. ruderalis TaxID=1480154 RepID=A0A176WIG2_MARPO|nr:hypothetical protein AXG93_2384s1000 [Marchantia polymorpha subsp. ruderalis]